MKADREVQLATGRRGAADRALRCPPGGARRHGERVHQSDRRAEERALVRGSEAPAGAARGRRQIAVGYEHRVAPGRSGKAQQGAAGDAARAAGDRQPRAEGSDRRRGCGEGKPRRVRRDVLLRDGPAGISGRGLGVARAAGGRRDRVRQDGAARKDRRERPDQPGRRAGRRGFSRLAARTDVQGQGRGALRPGQPRQLLRADLQRLPPVRRHLPVRNARSTAPGRRVGARVHRGQGSPERAARAAAGGLRQERQEPCVREDRRSIRAA